MTMNKQILGAFLCGIVLPLLIVLAAGRLRQEDFHSETQQGEISASSDPSESESQAQESSYSDADQMVDVLQDSGDVKQMDLESYLVGVVLGEMPADFELEALKAQAVVARTYTCRRMENGKHENASVCTNSDCCQAFRAVEDYLQQGGTDEAVERVRRAVHDTAGDVLLYQGDLIDATYFSCSGGFTEDAVAVWGKDIPYLQSVESPGEEDAPRFSDERSFSAQELSEKLGVSSSEPLTDWFGKESRTEGGGVDQIHICGKVFSGREVRSLLGLRSTVFDIEIQGDRVCFHTKGFGHRVGMSQYGAQVMAKEGKNYQDILLHYYQGTEFGKVESYMS